MAFHPFILRYGSLTAADHISGCAMEKYIGADQFAAAATIA
ncbi:hypothetical protein USDA257_c20780 [Sinorhizobium fredii USDA 257]|uniref:Uncharacterized protein n=1 Tax=Sinorhizobium fredii (strain USDA 257) TaxID=1185652 RepID=I3X454_SINF2|nr:hypothetical protein USDA257_c20780 [Sinorhizobium fredii USDA 257]